VDHSRVCTPQREHSWVDGNNLVGTSCAVPGGLVVELRAIRLGAASPNARSGRVAARRSTHPLALSCSTTTLWCCGKHCGRGVIRGPYVRYPGVHSAMGLSAATASTAPSHPVSDRRPCWRGGAVTAAWLAPPVFGRGSGPPATIRAGTQQIFEADVDTDHPMRRSRMRGLSFSQTITWSAQNHRPPA
jgi:hypothetical protein